MILVVGDIGIDVWVTAEVERLNPEGPAPLARLEHERLTLGMAGNVAAMVAALGEDVVLVGAIEDGKNSDLYECFGIARVLVDPVMVDCCRTPVKTRYMIHSAGRTPQTWLRIDAEQRDPVWLSELVLERASKHYGDASAILLVDHGKGSLLGQITLPELGCPVVVDPKRGRPWSDYGQDLTIKCNRHEAAAVGFDHRSDQCERALRELRIEAAIVTLEQDGVALRMRSGHRSDITGEKRSVADVTGAGDQFSAALAVMRSRGVHWETAARVANIAAGIQVEKLGCDPVTIDELKRACGSLLE